MKTTVVCFMAFVVGFYLLNVLSVEDLDEHLEVSFSCILFFWLNLIKNFLLHTVLFV